MSNIIVIIIIGFKFIFCMNDVPRPLAVAVVIVDCSAVIGVASKKTHFTAFSF